MLQNAHLNQRFSFIFPFTVKDTFNTSDASSTIYLQAS